MNEFCQADEADDAGAAQIFWDRQSYLWQKRDWANGRGRTHIEPASVPSMEDYDEDAEPEVAVPLLRKANPEPPASA